MKREQILINSQKLKQLEDLEKLRDQLIEGKNMWWSIYTPKHPQYQGTQIVDESSRQRFMAWLENEITVLKMDLRLEEEE
ncbi:MAG TPA: hypothetical protein DEF30_08365 [Proteiniclasticum sp.]|uniref:hypothetical protein n=1 Tax=Proteiniclasticum sp. TaxID=2053595 RepID=UPI000E9EBF5F|nr:hypothetical protein [Proteiniclasticum sp.]HBW13814.1 hypothetical protein [Proteiniclasticum sp.]